MALAGDGDTSLCRGEAADLVGDWYQVYPVGGLLAVSLLSITAGRVCSTSPRTNGSRDISQISPRRGVQSVAMAAGLSGNVGVQCTAPGFSTSFAGLVSCHCGIAVAEVLTDNVWAGEVVDEAADAATSHSLRHPQQWWVSLPKAISYSYCYTLKLVN